MNGERRFKKYAQLASQATKTSIDENPFVIKTTSQYARDVKINRKLLQAAFKELTGVGIQEYQLMQRMERSRQLLKEGNCSIKEIAISCGYRSQRAFTTAFKRFFGITPTEYQHLHYLQN